MSLSPSGPGTDREILASLGVRGPLTDAESALYVRYLRGKVGSDHIVTVRGEGYRWE